MNTPLPDVTITPFTFLSALIAPVAAASSVSVARSNLFTDSLARSNLSSAMPSPSSETLRADPE